MIGAIGIAGASTCGIGAVAGDMDRLIGTSKPVRAVGAISIGAKRGRARPDT
jgi:hypothetical protein